MLVSIASTTGGAKSFTGAITDGNDGDGNGISLTSNTGATITFSGGLLLSTGANAAFTATGGGTSPSATRTLQSGRDRRAGEHARRRRPAPRSTSPTPPSAPTALEFRSISGERRAERHHSRTTRGRYGRSHGHRHGPAGSGGTIQNITNRGASFINAVNISLTDMNFTNANTTDGGTSGWRHRQQHRRERRHLPPERHAGGSHRPG